MSIERLSVALAKADRAKAQIADVDAEVVAFFKAHPYEVVTDVDQTDGRWIYRFSIPGKIPHVIPIMIGEVLHNLRSALDQMACGLVQSGRSVSGTYFPFGADITVFKSQLADKGKKLPAEARDMIAALKPYPGGNDILWAIHDLNRRDKHIEVVTTGMAPGLKMRGGRVLPGPRVFTIGARKGHHFIIQSNGDAVAPKDDARPTFLIDEHGPCIHFSDFGTDDDFEFMTGEPGINAALQFEPAFTLALRNVKGFEREPVIITLHKMRDLVENTVLTFQKRFF